MWPGLKHFFLFSQSFHLLQLCQIWLWQFDTPEARVGSDFRLKIHFLRVLKPLCRWIPALCNAADTFAFEKQRTSVFLNEADATRKENENKSFLINRFFVRMSLISSKCLLKQLHISYHIPDSFTTAFVPQLAVFLWMAGWESHKGSLKIKKSQLHAFYCISIVEPGVMAPGRVHVSPGRAALRPGHSGGPPKRPLLPPRPTHNRAAIHVPRRNAFCTVGRLKRKLAVVWREQTDGRGVDRVSFEKATQRILWQRLRQLITSPLTFSLLSNVLQQTNHWHGWRKLKSWKMCS